MVGVCRCLYEGVKWGKGVDVIGPQREPAKAGEDQAPRTRDLPGVHPTRSLFPSALQGPTY
jgi:hypothetical protein